MKNKNPALQAAVLEVVQWYGVYIAAYSLNKIGIEFEDAYEMIFGRKPRV